MISHVRNGLKNLTLAIALLALLTACAQPPAPVEVFYRLQISPPEKPLSSPPIAGIVEVAFAAEGLVDDRNINYSSSNNPSEVSGYTYRLWATPPKVVLRDQFIAYLRAAGFAAKVVEPETRAAPDYLINGKIKRLEKIDGASPKAKVDLELALLKADGNKLVTLGVYDVVEDALSNSVADAVVAMDKALTKIFARFVEDIEKK